MKELPLSRGLVAIVDDEDYQYLSQWKWSLLVVRNKHKYAYRPDWPSLKLHMLHRVIMGVADKKLVVDHKDHNGLNCRRENLRIATRQQNQFNLHREHPSSSKFKGVAWNKKAQKWIANIRVDGKSHYLGSFSDEREAADAYRKYALAYHGEFFCE
jgi:ribosomal protein L15E